MRKVLPKGPNRLAWLLPFLRRPATSSQIAIYGDGTATLQAHLPIGPAHWLVSPPLVVYAPAVLHGQHCLPTTTYLHPAGTALVIRLHDYWLGRV